MKIKKNDKVIVTTGKDKGRKGVIERVYNKQNKVLIVGVNIYKKHAKKSQQLPKGGVVELPRPINISKIALICQKCQKQTRIGYLLKNNRKIRICKKCKSAI